MKKIIENWNVEEYRFKHGIYHLWITDKHHYVGSSINLSKRLLRHRSDLIRNDHANQIMQRCFNKYGYNLLKWEILEICSDDILYQDLLIREKYYIDTLQPDMNIKLDPITQQACPTTSKKVFQFNQFGEFIDEWECVSEAARHLKINSSGITVACLHRNRQRICAGYLWDYEPIYTGKINLIYTFDLSGNYLDKFYDTKSIYEAYFPNKQRKTVLSQLNKKIDSNKPYENIYLTTNKDFKVNLNYKPKYKTNDELDIILKSNPIIYKFDKDGNILDQKRFRDWPNYSNFIRKQVRIAYTKSKCSKTYYSIDLNFKPPRFSNYNEVKIKVINQITGEIKKYPSIKDAVNDIFSGTNEEMNSYYRNTRKHILRNTQYKGYLFERDL